MHLKTCIDRLDQTGLLTDISGSTGMTIGRVTGDSRALGPSDLFVAIRGVKTDGHLFIDKAVKNGATAIVCEAGPEGPASTRDHVFQTDVTVLTVTDSRRALCELASLQWADPGKKLALFGVTGTNGKTTIATLVADVLRRTGRTCGFLGTTGIHDGAQSIEATHTTPSPEVLYETLGAMVGNGCSHASLEVSSHAIDQARLRLSDVDVALFTNLTRDHLDYHGTWDAYRTAKKGLFDALSDNATAIVNADDPEAEMMLADCAAHQIRIRRTPAGIDPKPDDSDEVSFQVHEDALSGLDLTIDGDRRRYRLSGDYNAFNLAAAFAASRALGLDRDVVLNALADAEPIRGRFEHMVFEGNRTVVIDYAHTPDALENVLSSIASSKPDTATLWCLFGCGGDRDRGKRPRMGAIAESIADRIIVTSDNPRSEDPLAILADVRTGLERPSDAMFEADRGLAIDLAAEHMAPGDVLVLAGKGHETVQVIGTERLHFDDRKEAVRAFGQLQVQPDLIDPHPTDSNPSDHA